MNLLLGHAALYQIKVADALLGGSAAQLDAAAGRHIGQMRCRNLNIAFDNVTEAEVCVNVGRSHLAGATARITVAGPVTASPPANTCGVFGTNASDSA